MILAIFLCVLLLAMCFLIGLWFDGFDNLESGGVESRNAMTSPSRLVSPKGVKGVFDLRKNLLNKNQMAAIRSSRISDRPALHSLSGREKHNLRRVLLARISERRK